MSKTVGNYTLVEKLGQGSYATVYKGYHKVNGGDYAVKVISRQRIGNEKLQRNLEQEISIMKDISHENVVRLFGTFTSKNNIYLVLEYCGGGDL
jgi:serine/threonine-protein kinase ULK/ATG1